MIDGTLPSTKKNDVEKFQKKAKQILDGIDPRTVPIQIECRLNAGDDYLKITDVLNVWNDEPANIEHKQG